MPLQSPVLNGSTENYGFTLGDMRVRLGDFNTKPKQGLAQCGRLDLPQGPNSKGRRGVDICAITSLDWQQKYPDARRRTPP